MSVPPVVKRYNKLVPKFLTWSVDQSIDESTKQSLVEKHAELINQSTNWPTAPIDASTNPSNDQLESILKSIESFMRDVQVASGLGKGTSTEMTPEERKAARQAANKENAAKKAVTGASKGSKIESAKGSKDESAKGSKKIEIAALSAEQTRDLAQRCAVWDRVASHQSTNQSSNQPIKITLPDGKQVDGIAGQTTPYQIAKQISKSKAETWLIAKITPTNQSADQSINQSIGWDMMRPLESDCSITFFDFDSPEGAHTYWHSSAHLLGQALERIMGDSAKLTVGPALAEGGFYYDFALQHNQPTNQSTDQSTNQPTGEKPAVHSVTPEMFPKLESVVNTIIKEKQTFTRLVLKKEEALEMFANNKYKQYIISTKVPDGETCTAYRCGPLIDLCRGPHVPNSAYIKALAVTKNSSSYWLGDATNDSLQRVYGISFPSQQQLDEWLDQQRQAEERDHRRLGVAQQLFMFHDLSPGSAFMLPHGTRVYNKLVDYMRNEYVKRGYSEVLSPNIFNVDLWKTSGHYQNYKEHMFLFECEKQEYALKPMNCPAHCLMFHNSLHSYKELPVRLADFGVLHRNEFSGALSGLTRVRRFQQDDAHIFCRPDQIKSEIAGVLDMLESVYGVFGFRYSLALSTRPEKYLGEIAVWDKAEAALTESLDEFVASKNQKDQVTFDSQPVVMDHHGKPQKFKPLSWSINPADGAFYGPKIDIQLTDALNRKHQCATIQLDFQLPLRFGLGYKTEEGVMEHPVMIHRAILGSVERMMAVLIEHTGGKWPLWLSPRQVAILPINQSQHAYCHELQQTLKDQGLYVDVDDDNSTLNKKILKAQQSQYNLILVIGAKEVEAKTVTIRHRDHAENIETKTIEEFKQYCNDTIAQFK